MQSRVSDIRSQFTPEALEMLDSFHENHRRERGMTVEEYRAFCQTPEGKLANLYRPFAKPFGSPSVQADETKPPTE